MKTLTFLSMLLLVSCSVLDTAKQAVSIPYEAGKMMGKMEILDELSKNKKKLNVLRKTLAHQLVDLSLKEEDESVEIHALLPPLLGLVQLLNQRQELKKMLKNAQLESSETESASEE